MTTSKKTIDLGYLQRCASWEVESRMFPSKVGGKPAWLNLENIPTPETLQCLVCNDPLVFLCQIYAPIDNEDHFHRTVFIFICRNPKCCIPNCADNIRVFRSSLPRENPFYPPKAPAYHQDTNFSLENWLSLCSLCGCLGTKKCSKCRNISYCSRHHQVLDWKNNHRYNCEKLIAAPMTGLPSILFEEFEILIEPDEAETNFVDKEKELQKFEKLNLDGKAGTLTEITEEELSEHASIDNDKTFTRFRKRIRTNPDQVVRYCREGEPLWIAQDPIPDEVPDCEYCGSPRVFEFQVMPQMLSLLKENNLDWGVLVVYTCKISCLDMENSYKNEFVFKQDVSTSSAVV